MTISNATIVARQLSWTIVTTRPVWRTLTTTVRATRWQTGLDRLFFQPLHLQHRQSSMLPHHYLHKTQTVLSNTCKNISSLQHVTRLTSNLATTVSAYKNIQLLPTKCSAACSLIIHVWNDYYLLTQSSRKQGHTTAFCPTTNSVSFNQPIPFSAVQDQQFW